MCNLAIVSIGCSRHGGSSRPPIIHFGTQASSQHLQPAFGPEAVLTSRTARGAVENFPGRILPVKTARSMGQLWLARLLDPRRHEKFLPALTHLITSRPHIESEPTQGTEHIPLSIGRGTQLIEVESVREVVMLGFAYPAIIPAKG